MKTALRIRPYHFPTFKARPEIVDPFVAELDSALSQVDPKVGGEVRWLANVGLIVEAERLLIDYLLADHQAYEVVAEQQSLARRHKLDSLLFCVWMCRIVDWNTIGTFAGCMSWVMMGS